MLWMDVKMELPAVKGEYMAKSDINRLIKLYSDIPEENTISQAK